jgi:hypothetical protein
MGTLDAPGGAKLRLVVHFARGEDGVITATMDSLDQGRTVSRWTRRSSRTASSRWR